MNAIPFVVRVWAAGSMTRWLASYAVAGGPEAMATLIAQFDPFQGAPCVRLPAVGTLCALADLGFPALCEDMQNTNNRANVGAFVREVNEARARVDCGAWDAAFQRDVMRAVRAAYVATAA